MLEASIIIITKNIIPARFSSPILEKRHQFNWCLEHIYMKREMTGKSTTALKICSVEKYRVRSIFLTFLKNYT